MVILFTLMNMTNRAAQKTTDMQVEHATSLFDNIVSMVGGSGVVRLVQWPERASVIASFRYLNGQPVLIDSYYNAIRERAGSNAQVSVRSDADERGRVTVRIVATMKE